ncbi:hypothetical protein OH491_19990 [Termitidicoccus mucosus]
MPPFVAPLREKHAFSDIGNSDERKKAAPLSGRRRLRVRLL